jgi:hypothetical protein
MNVLPSFVSPVPAGPLRVQRSAPAAALSVPAARHPASDFSLRDE